MTRDERSRHCRNPARPCNGNLCMRCAAFEAGRRTGAARLAEVDAENERLRGALRDAAEDADFLRRMLFVVGAHTRYCDKSNCIDCPGTCSHFTTHCTCEHAETMARAKAHDASVRAALSPVKP